MSLSDTRPGELHPGAQAYYYVTDGLSSVRVIVDDSGSVVDESITDEFGRPETSPATAGLSAHTYVGGAGYRNETAGTGLYYLRQRWYDPGLGKFLSQDPIGFRGGWNLSNYVGNDPVNAVDPLGLVPVIPPQAPPPAPPALPAAPSMWERAIAVGRFLRGLVQAAEAAITSVEVPVAAPVIVVGLAASQTNPRCPGDTMGADRFDKMREVKEARKPFAIGFMKYLYGFAAQHGAETWRDYAPVPWRDTVSSKVSDPLQDIYVNMRDLDAKSTWRRNRLGQKLTCTDEELVMVNTTYSQRRSHTFWYNGPNPIERGFNER